jgi:hypothetical protein
LGRRAIRSIKSGIGDGNMKKALSILIETFLVSASLFGSNASGTGQSILGCVGGPGHSCQRSDASAVQESLSSTFVPTINHTFIDPDFGLEFNLVTGPTTPAISAAGNNGSMGVDTGGGGFGAFDSSIGTAGGYRFYGYTSGGVGALFTLDATTEQTVWVPTSLSQGWLPIYNGIRGSPTDPRAFYGPPQSNVSDSTCDAGAHGSTAPCFYLYCAPGSATDTTCSAYSVVTNYGSPNFDSLATVYDWSNCPNVPANAFNGTWGLHTGLASLGIDSAQAFTEVFAGVGQNYQIFVLWYSLANGHCDWENTENSTAGGDDYSGVVSLGGTMAAPAAPTLGTTSGSLPADYIGVVTTFTTFNASGEDIPTPESLPSPYSYQLVNGSQAVTVVRPAIPSDQVSQTMTQKGAIGPYEWNVYACAAASSGCTNALLLASVPWATSSYTITSVSGSQPPPVTSWSGCSMHGGQLVSAQDSGAFRSSFTQGVGCIAQMEEIWQPVSGPYHSSVLLCGELSSSTGYCGGDQGHPFGSPGISGHAIYFGQSPTSDLALSYFDFASPYTLTNMVPVGPQPSITQDSHINTFDRFLDPTGLLPSPQELTSFIQDTTIRNTNGQQNSSNPMWDRTRFGENESVQVSNWGPEFCSGTPCPATTIWQMWSTFDWPQWINLTGNYVSNEDSLNSTGIFSTDPLCTNPSFDGKFIVCQSNFMDRLGVANIGNSGSYLAWTSGQTGVGVGQIEWLPAGSTYQNATAWMVAITAGTTGATTPTCSTLGQVSNDGGVSWECWGANPGTTGDSFPRWQPSTAYIAGQFVQDSNQNWEFCTTGGTSASSPPSWPTSGNPGTVTETSGVAWRVYFPANYQFTEAPFVVSAGNPVPMYPRSRYDLFVIRLR